MILNIILFFSKQKIMFLLKKSGPEPVKPMLNAQPSFLVGAIVQVYSGKTYQDYYLFP